MKKIIAAIYFMMASTFSMAQYQPLYDGKIPNYIDAENEESEATTGGILRISKVSIPGYAFFAAGDDKSAKPCVIICPGGGYGILAAQHEGIDVAKFFNSIGVHALVLKYRIPSAKNQYHKEIAPLQDAQQAIYLVRKNARKWRVDAGKIGIMGFSAGGHLASSLAVHYNDPKNKFKGKTSLRPDFQVLIYPVVSFVNFPHLGSRNNLLKPDTTASLIQYYSSELQVDQNTPPAFLVHAKDDKTVPIENSYQYVEALKKNGVASELFIYEKGGHGFGLVNKTSDLKWTDALVKWMISREIIRSASGN
jgi:acetyl esterase/lipase